MRIRIHPYLILIIPPLCWAGNIVLARAMHADIPPAAMNFWRWLLAGVILTPFAAQALWTNRDIVRDNLLYFVKLSVTGIVLFHVFVYQALNTTTAVNASLILATVPGIIPIFSYALHRETPTPRQIVGIMVSVIGVAIIITRGDWAALAGFQFNQGDAWMLLAAPVWAYYSVILKDRPKGITAMPLLLAITAIGSLLMVPIYGLEAIDKGGFAITPANLATVSYMGVFAAVIAYVAWNRGVAEVGAIRAGLFMHLIPVFTLIMAVVFLGENLWFYHGVGIVLIALGIFLNSKGALPAPVAKS